jgi:hypothetical protein
VFKPDVQAGANSVNFTYSMPVDGIELPHSHSVGILLRISRQNAHGRSSPSSKQVSLMPTGPNTTTSAKHIEPSKPAYQGRMPAFPPPQREVTLHSTGRKDNDKSLLPAVQPDWELETVPRMRCGFHPVPIKIRDKSNLGVWYYSRSIEKEFGLCEYHFAVR